MARFVSDVKRIMRLAIGRRNENDPDSSDSTLMQYIQDAIHLTMSDDLKIFEQFGTKTFEIDETNTTGVYSFDDVDDNGNLFTNLSAEAFITLTDPPEGSVSWNPLLIYQDPGQFYGYWGVNNTDILIPGYPTDMLYYGTEMVFRTIPDQAYTVMIYGYKVVPEFSSEGDPALPHDYWLRYLAYLAAKNYASDYRYESNDIARIDKSYQRERKLLLTRTHSQITKQRAFPRF